MVVALLVGVVVSAIGLGVSYVAAGYGHGTYIPAIFLFPWSMALTGLVGYISMPLIVLGGIQFPAYASFVAKAPGAAKRRAAVLATTHLVAIGIAFAALRGGSFLP